MQISLEWLSDFVDLPPHVDVAALVYDLTMKTVEVEHATDLGALLPDVIVARVREAEAVERGPSQIRCAVGERTFDLRTTAPGVSSGMLVAVTLDGQGSGVVHTAAELGVEGIFPVRPGDAPTVLDLTELEPDVGSSVADLLGWNDTVLEIDNKSLTNRPDLWCHHGIARELAAIYGCELKPPRGDHGYSLGLTTGLVGGVDESVCERMSIIEIATAPSTPQTPLWIRSRLARVGQRAINLYADLTNYVMYSVGQPSHVYDGARAIRPFSVARTDQPLTMDLLDGGQHDVPVGTAVITDGSGPRAIAGVVGDADTKIEVGATTVYLEMATFKPSPIRRSSLDLNVRTDSSTRFEKGIDTQRVDLARSHFLHLLESLDPAASVAGLQDTCARPTEPEHVEISLGFLSDRIGRPMDANEVATTLGRLGFETTVDGEMLSVTAPTWRSTGDISLPEDLVEEIARLIGYEEFPESAPEVRLEMPPTRPTGWLERRVREHLAWRAHMQEIVTYPWSADRYMEAAGHAKSHTLTIEGAPSPERNSLRPALLPNLLEAVEANLGHTSTMRIFEVGTVFGTGPRAQLTEPAELLPPEARHVAGAFVGRDLVELFRTAKGAVEGLQRACGLVSLGTVPDAPTSWSDPVAHVGIAAEGTPVGTIGAVATSVLRRLGIRDVNVVCFEFSLDDLSVHQSRDNHYDPISAFPEVDFDLSVVIDGATRWADVESVLNEAANPLVRNLAFVDQFSGGSIPEGKKSVTLRLTLGAYDHTLDSTEAAVVRDELVVHLQSSLGAELRS